MHFWIGQHSTEDEYGTAAYKTVELDDYVRKENDKFISQLKCKVSVLSFKNANSVKTGTTSLSLKSRPFYL